MFSFQRLITWLAFPVFLLVFSIDGAAQDLGERVAFSGDVITKAFEYSLADLERYDDRPGISVVIAYGHGNAVTAEQTGEAFVNEFSRRGYRARYFYYDADWEGMTVEYRIGYSVLGPWDADSAASQLGHATEYADGAQRVHKSAKN